MCNKIGVYEDKERGWGGEGVILLMIKNLLEIWVKKGKWFVYFCIIKYMYYFL